MGGVADTAGGPERTCTFQRIDADPNDGGPQPFVPGTSAVDPAVRTSRQELAEIERNAYARGYSEGEKAGLAQGNRQVTPVIDNFGQALQRLDQVKNELFVNAEKKTLDLAMAVARKIVCHEIRSNPHVILSVIREALARVVDPENITIRLSPGDYQFVNSSGRALAETIDHFEHITFKADESIGGGGCLIETRMGEIDARFDHQFKVIETLFESEFQKTGEATD